MSEEMAAPIQIKHWDKNTSHKFDAPSEPRLILLDGHGSHLSRTFIELAVKKNMHILCYPAK